MQLDRALYERVCKFLWEEWDPIGLKALDWTDDEYDNYAGGLIRLVRDGADEFKVAQQLDHLAQERMGLSKVDDEEHRRKVAKALINLIRG